MTSRLVQNLAANGVLPRSKTKNDLPALRTLLKEQLVKKVRKQGRVFYELTAAALPLLEHRRTQLCHEAQLRHYLYPRRRHWYDALLGKLRFFNARSDEAQDFLFLGDWRLAEPVTTSQLALAQFRYYQKLSL